MKWRGNGGMSAHRALLLMVLFAFSAAAHADEAIPPLSAQVKDRSTDKQETSAMPRQDMPAERPRPQPTTPGGKLPQYQLDRRRMAIPAADELNDPRLRLILALPAEPILVEASITIDAQPFHRPRERRIEQIIQQAEASDATTADASPNAASPDTLTARMRRYRQATGEPLTPDAVRWLLTNWVDGPTLLLLNDDFQRFRADQRPVFDLLDDDRDGTVEAEELSRAVEAFRQCDLNRNEIVEYTELADAADDPRRNKPELAGRGKLIFLLPDESSASETYRRLAAHYASGERAVVPRFDVNSDGRFDAAELAALGDAEPDVSFSVAFNSTEPATGRIFVAAASPRFAATANAGRADAGAITLPLGGAQVAFSAVQAGASDQVALGAVVDGYPLLPQLDPNEDGRFTLRELRSLIERLRKIDRNQDGRLTADEVQPTIRVCFGLGPQVHRELAGIRTLQPVGNQPATVGPEWFVRMDRNKDNDLTHGEFPGTNEQFAALDADADELVSAEEANRFDAEQPQP